MLPYIEVPPISLGGFITLQPFGLLVVAGCLVGVVVGGWHARTKGLAPEVFRRLACWILIPAFLLAHWLAHWISLVFYYPEALWRDPLGLLWLNTSLSSSGGLLGAGLGAISYWVLSGQKDWGLLRSYGDAVAVGWTVGWLFGRLGCTLAHDHPGLPTDFWLAVQFPDGPRHDLGLYEWLWTIGLNLLVFCIRGRALPAGMLLGLVSICYALVRFPLDRLRVEDTRDGGWTPGQYFCVALLCFGLWMLATARDRSVGRRTSASVHKAPNRAGFRLIAPVGRRI